MTGLCSRASIVGLSLLSSPLTTNNSAKSQYHQAFTDQHKSEQTQLLPPQAKIATRKMAALPAFTPPAAAYSLGPTPRAVRFRHPAYPDPAPDLLVLMAADDGDGGLDFDLALAACCIIAGVNWDGGYLALKASESNDLQRVDRPQDGSLHGREYFFCWARSLAPYREPSVDWLHGAIGRTRPSPSVSFGVVVVVVVVVVGLAAGALPTRASRLKKEKCGIW